MTSDAQSSAPEADTPQPATAAEAEKDLARQPYSPTTRQAREAHGGMHGCRPGDPAGGSLRVSPDYPLEMLFSHRRRGKGETHQAKVTVVLMTRDRPQRLRSTLARLAALPERPPVIVVDNASRFGLDELTGPALPDCRVLRLPRNIGAVARNLGVAAARTPYVAFADDDSWWAPGALTRAESHFAAHPRLALIAARLLVGPAERLDPVSAFMSAAPVGRQADLPGPSVLGFLACAALVRKDAFLASGGFDPVVFFMGEESRVAYDLTSAGWGLSYCHDVVAHHHPEPGPQPARKRMLAARNAALTAWMRRPARVALARTVTFLREGSWRYRGSFAWRLPQALALRRRPDAKVEAMCEVLERADPTR